MDKIGLIAQAGKNESEGRGTANLGDQRGWELNCIEYYESNCKWEKVYRFKDENIREQLAQFMCDCVSNGNIGYGNFPSRDTLLQELQSNGFHASQIVRVCNCDCSSLVYAGLYGITGVKFISEEEAHNGVSPYVREYDHYISLIRKAGYEVDELIGRAYVGGMDMLVRGDIIKTFSPHTSAHIAVIV